MPTASATAATVATAIRKEVQSHGFSWEKELLANVFRLTAAEQEEIKYTSKMDLPSKFNRLDGCDVSIKTTCSANAVCMADCLRIYDAVGGGTPYHCIVIHYKQDDTAKTKKIQNIIEIDLTDSLASLFGTISRAQLEELDRAVKAVPQKRGPTTEERAHMYGICDELQPRSAAIHLDIKCNSQQSRLQCSFNRFQDFLEKNPSRVVARSTTSEFRGGAISPEIVSGRRVFKAK